MADKGSSPLGAEEGGEAQKRAEMGGKGEETRPKQVGQQSVEGEGGQGSAEGSASVQEPAADFAFGIRQPEQSPSFLQPGAVAIHPQTGRMQVFQGQEGPATGQQQQDVLTTTQQTSQPAALQATVLERKKEGGFGGASIRIQDTGLAAAAIVGGVTVGASHVASQVTQSPVIVLGTGIAAGAMSLAAFWLANRMKADKAICKAVEKDGHIEVEKIEGGSLLVHVKFLSQTGYWVLRALNEKIHQGTDRTCLQLLLEDELRKIGWTGPIQVGLEGWWFADEEGQEEEEAEEEAGTEQEERWEWAGMVEKQSVPPSVTTEDSGLPEDVSSVATMSITSAGEVEEGPLKWLRARLQKHKDSPTARRRIKAYRSWEEGAELLTSSGYTDLGGVKALVQGFMLRDMTPPDYTSTVLYEQSYLNLNKAQLKQLMTSQLQADPTDSTCLLLTALQLPFGDSRVQTLQQVVDAILQHGPGDWLYQHLHHIYCYLGVAIWRASPQPKPTMISKLFKGSNLPTVDLAALAKALSTLDSSLMYKQDHLETVYCTAVLSKEVSETEAIRQFEHFLRLAPECDYIVPDAHYHLATLYHQQQDRQKVIHHFTRGQQAEANRLPVFAEVPRSIKDPATMAYEQVMAKKQAKK
ncbi:PREDICTED: uncharacterized protein LOC109472920 [Branchiostoma belcheri]|uniref:Uncharacterized protein LOC109472920 n=1 Tax=Branchiostoma belcheri TaxID=7741 RepID=A0A6P4YGG8_BRABE|nr:PREDICTED: uncharacterized protein LOC109472920 [Branchiostoma belcheri]